MTGRRPCRSDSEMNQKMIRKSILTLALGALCLTSFAGDYVTNTSMPVQFLRNPAQQAQISVYGAYYNPAGVAFMDNGFHIALSWEIVHQNRYPQATYSPFAMGKKNNGSDTKSFQGNTNVPFLPSVFATYTHNRWAASFNFQIIGGGGKCEFPHGLSSFEAPLATIPALLNGLGSQLNPTLGAMGINIPAINGYDVDTYVKGEQLFFSGQLNFSYKVLRNLSVSVGGRLVLANAKNEGYIKNYQLASAATGGQYVPAGDFIDAIGQGLMSNPAIKGMVAQNPALAQQLPGMLEQAKGLVGDRDLDVKQKDVAFAPILSVDYKGKKFNLSARYEFRTRLRLKNTTKVNTTGVAKYDDGNIINADLPAQLALGGEYSILPWMRVDLQYNHYFNDKTKQGLPGENLQKNMSHNTNEYLAGLEFDITKKLTASAGTQITRFGYGDNCEYFDDTSFNPSSASLGIGLMYKFNDKVAINVGYFRTFYEHCTKTLDDFSGYGAKIGGMLGGMAAQLPPQVAGLLGSIDPASLNIPGKFNFYRKSFVFGVGVDFSF